MDESTINVTVGNCSVPQIKKLDNITKAAVWKLIAKLEYLKLLQKSSYINDMLP